MIILSGFLGMMLCRQQLQQNGMKCCIFVNQKYNYFDYD